MIRKRPCDNFEVFGTDDISGRKGVDLTSTPATSGGGYPLKKFKGKYAMELTIIEKIEEQKGRELSHTSNKFKRFINSIGIK